MNPRTKSSPIHTRRQILQAGASALPGVAVASHAQGSDVEPATANGGTWPYPIPWLDKNGSRNQPAGSNLEPSHIYHFKGRLARCGTLTGMGSENKGNRLAFWQSNNRLA